MKWRRHHNPRRRKMMTGSKWESVGAFQLITRLLSRRRELLSLSSRSMTDGRWERKSIEIEKKNQKYFLRSLAIIQVNEIIVIVDIVVNWWFRVIARDCRLSLGKYEWTINNRIWWGFDRMDQQPNKIRWLENWISSVSVNRLLSNHAVQCRRMWPPVSTAEVFLIPGSWQVIQT